MNVHSPSPWFVSFNPNNDRSWTSNQIQSTKFTTLNNVKQRSNSSPTLEASNQNFKKSLVQDSLCSHKFCSCGRRRFIQALGTTLFPISTSNASDLHSDPTIAGYKSQLFTNLRGKATEVLEIGIGTGPNLQYYAGDMNIRVFGIDPNRKMEKYAQAAAVAAGLPPTNFEFIQAVAEALPLADASVDAVVGTLVLCSVKDVDLTLKEVRRVLKPGGLYLFVEHVAAKDGTILRFVQDVLDPLQQTVSDGCHLTRQTGNNISKAGFLSVDINMTLLSNASFISPHVYGIACK